MLHASPSTSGCPSGYSRRSNADPRTTGCSGPEQPGCLGGSRALLMLNPALMGTQQRNPSLATGIPQDNPQH